MTQCRLLTCVVTASTDPRSVLQCVVVITRTTLFKVSYIYWQRWENLVCYGYSIAIASMTRTIALQTNGVRSKCIFITSVVVLDRLSALGLIQVTV